MSKQKNRANKRKKDGPLASASTSTLSCTISSRLCRSFISLSSSPFSSAARALSASSVAAALERRSYSATVADVALRAAHSAARTASPSALSTAHCSRVDVCAARISCSSCPRISSQHVAIASTVEAYGVRTRALELGVDRSGRGGGRISAEPPRQRGVCRASICNSRERSRACSPAACIWANSALARSATSRA
jgi:hypothetical protein